MKVSVSAISCSKEGRVGSRINLRFPSSKTLKVEGLEILDEDAVVFSGQSFMEEEEEEEEEEGEDSCTEGSRLPEMLGFAESKET